MNASEQIAFDLAKKCGEDVSAAIMRSLSLAEEQGELITIATNAVLAALTVAAGVYDGLAGQPVGTTPLRSVMDGILEVRDEYRREQPAPAHPEGRKAGEPDFAKSIEYIIKQESLGGAACGWQPCTGCHETVDGRSTGNYPVSSTFGCEVGFGCHECGGLGVVWHHYDAQTLANMEKDTLEGARAAATLATAKGDIPHATS